jgi:acyl-CoA hydrolase
MTDAPASLPDTPRPNGELSIRTLAMPADTNQNGDIFGGWLLVPLSQKMSQKVAGAAVRESGSGAIPK